MEMHWNVICDGCEATKMVHHRYKCLRCNDYDLCAGCYENKVETGTHSSTHPFQCLLDRAARELFFAGEEITELFADSFTCPFCGKMGHTDQELVEHVQTKHRKDSTLVICPLCVAVSLERIPPINNLACHVSIKHASGFQYAASPDSSLELDVGIPLDTEYFSPSEYDPGSLPGGLNSLSEVNFDPWQPLPNLASQHRLARLEEDSAESDLD
ncbi:E3 ubiquitin-protein ligase KCMF1 [Drosophila grimshawi]|nr:E3 ubiquitin-protein ligase KCMF1 [Drosophila grimshawi]